MAGKSPKTAGQSAQSREKSAWQQKC